MYVTFNQDCRVGVVTVYGDMTTTVFRAGDTLEAARVSASESGAHQDLELTDGTLLLTVPMCAVSLEEEYADCV